LKSQPAVYRYEPNGNTPDVTRNRVTNFRSSICREFLATEYSEADRATYSLFFKAVDRNLFTYYCAFLWIKIHSWRHYICK